MTLGLLLLGSNVANAAPPLLPEGDDEPAEAGAADAAQPAAEAPEEATPPAEDPAEEATEDDSPPPPPATDEETVSGSISASTDAEPAQETTEDDPGNADGRREPVMLGNAGTVGLFHTSLPDAGGRFTFRFRLYTDFFRRRGFIYRSAAGEPDLHSRVRGGILLSFSPFEWGELFFGVKSSANRNERDQADRQDAPTMFALGDLSFGVKGAYRFKKYGIGLGAQIGLDLLTGSSRLFTKAVNFWGDLLFALDIRYLTKNHFPFRYTLNLGAILDNSLRTADFARISDPVSREVTRFSLGANHSRFRMRMAADFPVRLGKRRQFGIDPILEWQFDVAVGAAEQAFSQANFSDSPVKRGSSWLTVGLRGNVVSGLHLDAAVDIGLLSPNFEHGPPTPPWQVMLALGWSFDPKPIIKKEPVKSEAPPPAPDADLPGRIVGQVVGPDGQPVTNARIMFPGLAANAIVVDGSGNFTSYRFPAQTVPIQVIVDDKVVQETSAEVKTGEDTQVTIELETAAGPATGNLLGTFTDPSGKGVQVRVLVVGQGVNEGFDSTPTGEINLLLYEGSYRATVSAPGFKDKAITFTVEKDKEVTLREQLESAGPPQTPNVSARGNAIRFKHKVRYSGNDVASASHPYLDELAAFLNHHQEFELIEIGVHTDDRGAAQTRSEQRAQAVVSYLVSKGVRADRLEAKGYGASRPVAVNLTSSGRAKNNRTTIVVRKSK